MAEKPIKVQLADGSFKEYEEMEDIAIDESTERWSEMKLKDGATIRVKLSVIQVLKIKNQYDPEGNPLYAVKGAPIISVVSVPEGLRQKANKQ